MVQQYWQVKYCTTEYCLSLELNNAYRLWCNFL